MKEQEKTTKQRRKPKSARTSLLVQTLGLSLIVHLIVGVIVGGYVISVYVLKKEVEQEQPVNIVRMQPEKLQYKVSMQQSQAQSAAPPPKRISVQAPTEISISNIDIELPNIAPSVDVGMGAGTQGHGFGQGLGNAGALNITAEVNFFGIRSSAEKIYLIVSADKRMLEDSKGGYPAYKIIKEEVVNIVKKLPTGILFNSILFSGDALYALNGGLRPVNGESNEKIDQWINPINTTFENAGLLPANNIQLPNRDIKPMKDTAGNWVRAMMHAFSNQADSVFLMLGEWNYHPIGLTGEEELEWLIKHRNWSREQEEQWKIDRVLAQEELERQNKVRKEKGLPQRVVHWIGTIALEMGLEARPPADWETEDIVEQLEHSIELYYTKKDLKRPSINIIYFVGKDQKNNPRVQMIEDQLKEVVKIGSRGRLKVLEGMGDLKRYASEEVQTRKKSRE